ncbi:MAG: RNA polymerase sigma factor [Rikenellaceae bacterium]
MTEKNEKEILKLLKSSKTRQQGFSLLMQVFREPIYWHIRRLVVKHEDAEDVMQESFINIYKYIDNFKGESSLKTWVYKIATNESLRHCTKRRLEMDSYDEKSKLVNLFESENDIDFNSAEAALQKALLSLPEKQRITFNLRYFEDMSYEQIAEVTNSSVATLKTNYHYASNKIKEYILNNTEV